MGAGRLQQWWKRELEGYNIRKKEKSEQEGELILREEKNEGSWTVRCGWLK